MTTNYVDIHARSDAEAPASSIISTLFGKLHKALVKLNESSIGITFPSYALTPMSAGSCLRIIGSPADLEALCSQPWREEMSEEIDVLGVRLVPAKAVHRVLHRVQGKTGIDRLRRRLMRRQNLTWDEACTKMPESIVKVPDLPWIDAESSSTGQLFRMYLRVGEVGEPCPGKFNAYGLSSPGNATTPWF